MIHTYVAMYIKCQHYCTVWLLSVYKFLTEQPGPVYFLVSSLPDETTARVDWNPLAQSTITSYVVAYSVYESVTIAKSIRLHSDTTSYVIQHLSK